MYMRLWRDDRRNAAEEKSTIIRPGLYIETGRKKGLGRARIMHTIYYIRIIRVYTYYCDNDDRNIMIYCV